MQLLLLLACSMWLRGWPHRCNKDSDCEIWQRQLLSQYSKENYRARQWWCNEAGQLLWSAGWNGAVWSQGWPIKARVLCYINEGHDVLDAEDLKTAIESHRGVTQCQVFVCEPVHDKQRTKFTLTNLHCTITLPQQWQHYFLFAFRALPCATGCLSLGLPHVGGVKTGLPSHLVLNETAWKQSSVLCNVQWMLLALWRVSTSAKYFGQWAWGWWISLLIFWLTARRTPLRL